MVANLYFDVFCDVLSYKQAIFLAASQHYNDSGETLASCYASIQFDDIIKHNRDALYCTSMMSFLFSITRNFEEFILWHDGWIQKI